MVRFVLGQYSSTYTHVEPSQTAPGPSQGTLVLSTSQLLQPEDTPEPVLGLYASEIFLLVVKVRRDVVAEKDEE